MEDEIIPTEKESEEKAAPVIPRKKRTSLFVPAKQPQPPKPKKIEKLLAQSVRQYLTKMPLSKGSKIIPKGELTTLPWLDEAGIEKLIKVGAVRSVLSPPLAELAGWQTRAKRLEPVGVVTMADFLAVDADKLAKVLRTKDETVVGWQDQLRLWSKSEQPSRR